MKWLMQENDSDHAIRLLQNNDVAAPDFLLIECRNAALTNVRRGRLTIE